MSWPVEWTLLGPVQSMQSPPRKKRETFVSDQLCPYGLKEVQNMVNRLYVRLIFNLISCSPGSHRAKAVCD
eukprot:5106661-Amphidinium_carterae.1